MSETINFDKVFPCLSWRKSDDPFCPLQEPPSWPVIHWLATECLWVAIHRFCHSMPGRTRTGVVRAVTKSETFPAALDALLTNASPNQLLELANRSPSPFLVAIESNFQLKSLYLPTRTPSGARRTLVITELAKTDTHAGHIWIFAERPHSQAKPGGPSLADFPVRSQFGQDEYLKTREIYHQAMMASTQGRPINAEHLLSHQLLPDGSVANPRSRDPRRRGDLDIVPRTSFFRYLDALARGKVAICQQLGAANTRLRNVSRAI